ncbi:MAG: hypothetical protein P1U56_17485 [Saprospiraceae bacterium]|nr:hypothetical protein [Saprospiraceae bacterium]
MNDRLQVGDKIQLNSKVKKFDVDNFILGEGTNFFESIHFKVITTENFSKNKPLERVPIILSKYCEKVLRIETRDNCEIAYTTSFKVNVAEAIEKNEVIILDINSTIDEPKIEDDLYFNFITKLIECNDNFRHGLITKKERKSGIIAGFTTFYSNMFKEELAIRKIDEMTMSDSQYFKRTWNRFRNPTTKTKESDQLNEFEIVWATYPRERQWYDDFITECFNRELDDKISLHGVYFSGLHLNKNKYGDNTKCSANIKISVEQDDLSQDLIYVVDYWEKNDGFSVIKTKDIWANSDFKTMIDTIIQSPVY